MIARLTIAFVLGFTLMCGMLGTQRAARGQTLPVPMTSSGTGTKGALCPPDRPIRKTMDSGFATCTLVGCIGKLVCPPNVAPGTPDCYRMPGSDCNTCTRSVVDICLSQEELENAR